MYAMRWSLLFFPSRFLKFTHHHSRQPDSSFMQLFFVLVLLFSTTSCSSAPARHFQLSSHAQPLTGKRKKKRDTFIIRATSCSLCYFIKESKRFMIAINTKRKTSVFRKKRQRKVTQMLNMQVNEMLASESRFKRSHIIYIFISLFTFIPSCSGAASKCSKQIPRTQHI